MYFRQGTNWSLGVCSNPQLLMALYLRELGGISPLDMGPNSSLDCRAKLRSRLMPRSHGQIRQEWYSWWNSLVKDSRALNSDMHMLDLLSCLSEQGYPELTKLANAHYGQATLFAQEHIQDFANQSRDYIPSRIDQIEEILDDLGVDQLDGFPAVHIQLVEVPLSEPRAWLAGSSTVLASSSLLRDSRAFQGYIEPIVSIIFR